VSLLVTGTLALAAPGMINCCMTIFVRGCIGCAAHVSRRYGRTAGEKRRFIFSRGSNGPLADAHVLDAMLARATQNLADALRNLWAQ